MNILITYPKDDIFALFIYPVLIKFYSKSKINFRGDVLHFYVYVEIRIDVDLFALIEQVRCMQKPKN